MLNIIWPIFIIISFLYAIISGNTQQINDSIFSSTNDAINLCISLLGTICLWNGIMKIAQKTGIIYKITKIIRPIIKFLFPNINEKSEVCNEISMNIVANILGLGNAATPLGLKAMKSLQKENKNRETLTDEMIMFIVINTASIQLIPTTVIAIRSSIGSANPTEIVFPVWIATICAGLAGVMATKIFIKFSKKIK